MIDYDLVNWLLYALKTGIILAASLGLLASAIYAMVIIVGFACGRKEQKERLTRVRQEIRRGCRQTSGPIILPTDGDGDGSSRRG